MRKHDSPHEGFCSQSQTLYSPRRKAKFNVHQKGILSCKINTCIHKCIHVHVDVHTYIHTYIAVLRDVDLTSLNLHCLYPQR